MNARAIDFGVVRQSMQKLWMLLLAAAAMANGSSKREPDVVVFVHDNNDPTNILRLAEGMASSMLSGVGIAVKWRTGKPGYHGPAAVMEVKFSTPLENVRPGALAFATLEPALGMRIEIFTNRLRASRSDGGAPRILAHVLVHEITHLLEGIDRHSDSGLMKAHWDTGDWNRMQHAPLPFAAEDVRLIHEWSARRDRVLLARAGEWK